MQLIPKAPENNLRISCTVISTATAWAYFPWTDQYVFLGKKKTEGKFGMEEDFSLHRTVREYVGTVLFCLFVFMWWWKPWSVANNPDDSGHLGFNVSVVSAGLNLAILYQTTMAGMCRIVFYGILTVFNYQKRYLIFSECVWAKEQGKNRWRINNTDEVKV